MPYNGINISQPGHKETRRLIDLAPHSWFTHTDVSSIWVTGYRVLRVPKENFAIGPKVVDFNEVRAIVLYGALKYVDASQAKIGVITDNQWHIDVLKIQVRETSEGVYLLFLAPFAVDGQLGNEPVTREKISTAAGLFAAFNGRNIVYERLFDNIIEMSDGRTSTFSPVFENPMWFTSPDLCDSRLNIISKADKAITTLPEPDRNRIYLSLRWFEQALYESGIDAYLKYWISLETLVMPDTTNIRPLNESLSRAYNLSYEAIRDRFAIGKLFGLRCRIVHDGQLVPIHADLLRYMEALYADALLVHLGIPCDRRAASVIDNPEFALNEYLHEP